MHTSSAWTRPRAGTLLVLAALLVAVPGLLGNPVLALVTSASMSPTLATGDAVVVLPVLGPPQVGDVVVFHSRLHDTLAIHRIVGGTPEGWTTRGDANARTDQEGGEPPLTPDRLRGVTVALPGGGLLGLPGAGVPLREGQAALRAAGATDPLRQLAVGAVGSALLLAALPTRRTPKGAGPRLRLPERQRAHALVAVVGLVLLAVVLHAGTSAHRELPVDLVVVDGAPAGQLRSASPGQLLPRDAEVTASPLLPSVMVVEGGPNVHPRVQAVRLEPGTTQRVEVEVLAGPTPGLQRERLAVWPYPAFLPPEVILALHQLLPGLPRILFGGGVVAAATALLLAWTPQRHRSSRGWSW